MFPSGGTSDYITTAHMKLHVESRTKAKRSAAKDQELQAAACFFDRIADNNYRLSDDHVLSRSNFSDAEMSKKGLWHRFRYCENKTVIETFPFTLPSGDVVTAERFTCDTGVPVTKRELTGTLEVRQSSACTESNCVSFDGCRAVTQTIQAGHCTALAQQLENMSGTFTIPTNEGLGFILQSCEYTAFGSITETTQYCFHDMGVAATQIFATCGTQQGACEGANNGFFVDQISL
ncbi:hypothetical protein CPB84DRAFT_1748554 [Gymnopilus junonius]|uniref:Uncharacterized protein n=1 Tax=Gymnopilus junonius TaxID=109634 RepID=A0A9P5TKP8_GYMJU|nr:hypothetical protein CPB84DRAFT_1748554 [Gymnopilus junonius]